ncbi:MAG: hypothetical protein M1817_004979 [Caeruleum heppii]|nr:MAG: hypothetical protein M1817_004979 [Caeruleum heppii]
MAEYSWPVTPPDEDHDFSSNQLSLFQPSPEKRVRFAQFVHKRENFIRHVHICHQQTLELQARFAEIVINLPLDEINAVMRSQRKLPIPGCTPPDSALILLVRGRITETNALVTSLSQKRHETEREQEERTREKEDNNRRLMRLKFMMWTLVEIEENSRKNVEKLRQEQRTTTAAHQDMLRRSNERAKAPRSGWRRKLSGL